MKLSGKEIKYRQELFQLMQEHPDLPVIPMVDDDVVLDDSYSSWAGSWGPAHITRLWCGSERFYEYEPNNVDSVLNDLAFPYDIDAMTDEEAVSAYDALPWVKCIVVCIRACENW